MIQRSQRLNTRWMNLDTLCESCTKKKKGHALRDLQEWNRVDQTCGFWKPDCKGDLVLGRFSTWSYDPWYQQTCNDARIWNELNTSQRCTEPVNGMLNENKKWDPLLAGYEKCNIQSNWRNAKLHSRGFVIRDHRGNVFHYARKAFYLLP